MKMQVTDYSMYVAGEWTSGGSTARMDATSPATGEVIGTVPEGTREDARRAISAANNAWDAWAGRSAFERAAAMERVVKIIVERREDLARTLTLDQGKPLEAEAYDEVDELAEYFAMAAADATRLEGSMPPSVHADKRVLLYRVPRGVVGAITPWNWPYTMPAEILAPALGCGNAVVWVPAPSTSVCAVKLAECIVDAGLPEGIFNMVTGPGAEVGDEVAANPGTQAVGFIGSIETGQKVAARAAGKALLLEMGGNGPMVILDDADLDAVAQESLTSAFLGAGQSCTAPKGFPTDLYYRPTVLGKVTAEMRVSKEETFGPVIPATVIRDEEEAIRAVNSSPYGLLSAVFTRDLARGLRFAEKVRTGWVNINASSNHWESHPPFGGRAGYPPGGGSVGGRHPMETFTEFKTVILTTG